MHTLLHVLVPKEVAKTRAEALRKAEDFMYNDVDIEELGFDYCLSCGRFINIAFNDLIFDSPYYPYQIIGLGRDISKLSHAINERRCAFDEDRYAMRIWYEALILAFNKNIKKFIKFMLMYENEQFYPHTNNYGEWQDIYNHIVVQNLNRSLYEDLVSAGCIYHKYIPEGGEYIKYDNKSLSEKDINNYWVVYFDCHY